MLKMFRGVMKGPGALVVLALVVIAFAFVGLQGPSGFGRNEVVKVGDTGYSVAMLDAEFRRRIQSAQISSGNVLSRQEAIEAGLLRQTVNYFSQRGLIAEEADRLGLAVTDEMVQAFLRSDDGILNPETGDFDPGYLARVIQSNGFSLSEFQERVKIDLLGRQIEDGLLLPQPAPRTAASLFALRQTEQRDLDIAVFRAGDIEVPDDDTLRSYYEANAGRYRLPEQRRFSVVTITPESVRDRVTISEDELQQLYAARASSLGTPETRSFSQGQFSDAAAAARAADAARAGTPFDEAVEAEGGRVTQFSGETRDGLADDTVADAVFSLAEPGVAGPVDGIFGTVVLDVTEIVEGTEVSFEEARPELEDALFREIAAAELDIIVDDLLEAGDEGARLTEAAGSVGLETVTYGPLAVSDALPAGMAPDVRTAAFRAEEGAFFEEVPLEDGGYAFVELEEVIPATPRPFETAKDQVEADYLAEERVALLEAKAEELRLSVAGGEDFSAAAEALGASPSTRTVSAGTVPEDLTSALFLDAFTEPMGTVSTDLGEDGQSLTAVVVRDIRFGANAQYDQTTASVQGEFSAQLTQDLYQAYLIAAEQDIGVEVAEDILASRFGDSN